MNVFRGDWERESSITVDHISDLMTINLLGGQLAQQTRMQLHFKLWLNCNHRLTRHMRVQQKLKPGESIDYMEFTIKSFYTVLLFVHCVLHLHFISKIYNKHMCTCIQCIHLDFWRTSCQIFAGTPLDSPSLIKSFTKHISETEQRKCSNAERQTLTEEVCCKVRVYFRASRRRGRQDSDPPQHGLWVRDSF